MNAHVSSAQPARRTTQSGFSLMELMIVVAIGMVIAGFAVPNYRTAMRNYRISGDARDIKGELLLAKMRAASRFTWARVRFNLIERTFQTETWNKTTDAWEPVIIGAPYRLSEGVGFGTGPMTSPPVNPDGSATQTTLGQPPACTDGLAGTPPAVDQPGQGTDIPDTACILFNSRGFPVDSGGTLTSENAIYLTDGVAVEGSTLSVTGIAKTWRGDHGDTDYWQLRR